MKRLLSLAAAAALLALPCAALADGDFSLGTWWWHFRNYTAEERSETLAWLIGNGVTEIYLSCHSHLSDAAAGKEKKRREVADFIAEATSRGVRVEFLDGEVDWIQVGDQGFESTWAIYTNYQAHAAANERFSGIHLDIEPHQEAGYRDSKANETNALIRYCNLVTNRISRVAREAGEWLAFDTPHWYDKRDVPCPNGTVTNVASIVSAAADCVTLMAYQDSASSIFNCGKGEIPIAAQNGTKLVFGVETHSSEGDDVSFMEESQQEMFVELEKVRGMLRAASPTGNFGIAIHSVSHWRELKRWPDYPPVIEGAGTGTGAGNQFVIDLGNGVDGTWYTVYKATSLAGPYAATTSLVCHAAGAMPISVPMTDDAAFYRVGMSSSEVPVGTPLP